MKTEYTPGPWKVKTIGTFDKQGVFSGEFELMGEQINGFTVADCDYSILINTISGTVQDHHKRSNAVAQLRTWQQANAKLIAAAPDLLEALESAQKIVEAYDKKHGVHPSVKINIQKAISKARGL